MRSASPHDEKTHPAIVLPPSWDLVKPSIQLVRQNLDTLIWLVVIPSVLSVLANQLGTRIFERFSRDLQAVSPITDTALHKALHHLAHDFTATTPGQLAILLSVVGFIWSLLVYPATIVFMINAITDKHTDIGTSLRDSRKYFWRIYGVTFLVGIVVIAGLFLFIIPGLILLRRYLMAPFYVVDKDMGVREAMNASAAGTKPFKGYVWGTLGVMLVLSMIGSVLGTIPFIGFILALLVNYIYFFGLVLRYKTIKTATNA